MINEGRRLPLHESFNPVHGNGGSLSRRIPDRSSISSMSKIIVVMGVSGCGKTTVGQTLAHRLACPFYDGDDFHPPENVAKMAQGIPLTDMDRDPWLVRLQSLLHEHLARGEGAVLACSALKRRYRERLREGNDGLQFVYLQGDFALIGERMQTRPHHYMKADMLQSQFDALEPPGPDEAITVNITMSPDAMVENIMALGGFMGLTPGVRAGLAPAQGRGI